jgi:hypothetical protein
VVRRLPMPIQALCAEFVERCATDELASDVPIDGSFYLKKVGGSAYWYFRESAGPTGRHLDHYAGPDSEDLQRQVDGHRQAKERYRERRMIVGTLQRAGLPAPDAETGRVLQVLADAGIFRLGAVVVGTVAYQTYSGLLGVVLGRRKFTTNDLEIAQFQSASSAIGNRVRMPFGDLLRLADPRFEPIVDPVHPGQVTRYGAADALRVHLLTPNDGTLATNPVALPALQASAQPMRLLDFLIFQDVQAVMLFGAGVGINVPAPERFALYRLLIGCLRIQTGESEDKAPEELRQAGELIDALCDQRAQELRGLWAELTGRGPGWNRLANEAVALLDAATGSPATREKFQHVIGVE